MGESSYLNFDRLDDAFLFVLSIGTLGFTLVEVSSQLSNWYSYAIPVLFVGVLLPFYVGYLRGAVLGSTIERIRGWVYLGVGMGFTVVLVAAERGYLLPFGYLAPLVLYLLTLLVVSFMRLIGRRMLSLFPQESKFLSHVILAGGAAGAAFASLAVTLLFLEIGWISQVWSLADVAALPFALYIGMFPIALFVVTECTCEALSSSGLGQRLGLFDKGFVKYSHKRVQRLLEVTGLFTALEFGNISWLSLSRRSMNFTLFSNVTLLAYFFSYYLGIGLVWVFAIGVVGDILLGWSIVDFLWNNPFKSTDWIARYRRFLEGQRLKAGDAAGPTD